MTFPAAQLPLWQRPFSPGVLCKPVARPRRSGMAGKALRGERAAELGGAVGFDPDDGILAVPILIWLELAEELLVAAAVGAPAFAVFFYWKLLRSRARTGAVS